MNKSSHDWVSKDTAGSCGWCQPSGYINVVMLRQRTDYDSGVMTESVQTEVWRHAISAVMHGLGVDGWLDQILIKLTLWSIKLLASCIAVCVISQHSNINTLC